MVLLFDGVHLATNGPLEELHAKARRVRLKREEGYYAKT